jgi:hypothetical protein
MELAGNTARRTRLAFSTIVYSSLSNGRTKRKQSLSGKARLLL